MTVTDTAPASDHLHGHGPSPDSEQLGGSDLANSTLHKNRLPEPGI